MRRCPAAAQRFVVSRTVNVLWTAIPRNFSVSVASDGAEHLHVLSVHKTQLRYRRRFSARLHREACIASAGRFHELEAGLSAG